MWPFNRKKKKKEEPKVSLRPSIYKGIDVPCKSSYSSLPEWYIPSSSDDTDHPKYHNSETGGGGDFGGAGSSGSWDSSDSSSSDSSSYDSGSDSSSSSSND